MKTLPPKSKPSPPRRPDAPLMVADVARRWRTSYQKILDLVDEGRLLAFNIGGRNPSGRRFLRIPPESVQEFERLNSTLLDPKTGRLLAAPSSAQNRPAPASWTWAANAPPRHRTPKPRMLSALKSPRLRPRKLRLWKRAGRHSNFSGRIGRNKSGSGVR